MGKRMGKRGELVREQGVADWVRKQGKERGKKNRMGIRRAGNGKGRGKDCQNMYLFM